MTGMPDKQKILFVDDERNFLDSLRRHMRCHTLRWDMHFAQSVDDALALTERVSFDTIISDVHMPGLSGFDLLTALRHQETTRDIPVVILTGNTESRIKQRALDLGAADLLSKPVTNEDLVARIRSALRLKSYQDRLKDQNRTLEIEVNKKTADLELLNRDIIWRLAKAAEFRDEETGQHILRVALHSQILAHSSGLCSEEVNAIFASAPLHDVGKIGIPDAILLKPGKLDEHERKIMEKHCEIGAAILQDTPKGMTAFMEKSSAADTVLNPIHNDLIRTTAVSIAVSHHEKWDGSGYPNQLAGDEIPLAGRIVALADVYDALRSKRPYKEGFSEKTARQIIVGDSGSHFDPKLVKVFLKTINEFSAMRENFLT